jgi:hypothetical protein
VTPLPPPPPPLPPPPPPPVPPVSAAQAAQDALLRADFALLNPAQQRAVRLALCARDYALVHGMPGSGKTSAIAFLVRAAGSSNGSLTALCGSLTAL